MPSQTSLLGAAGEYYVMAELLRRGYIAALAPQGVPNVDIVVTDVDGGRLCSIQVKARRDVATNGGWHMSEKHEHIRRERLFYCLVDFGKTSDDRPTIHIVPSAIVADALKASHQQWLSGPGRGGRERRDSKMRKLQPDYSHLFSQIEQVYLAGWLDQYRSAWHLLCLKSKDDLSLDVN